MNEHLCLFLFQYMFGALRDCVLPLKQARHDPPEVMLDAFNQEILKHFDEVSEELVQC